MAELVFLRDGQELLCASLDRPRTSIGRGTQNDIALPDAAVSREHAVITRDGTGLRLVDLSGRGTTVDGRAERDVALRDGSTLRFGSLEARIRTVRGRMSEPTTKVHVRLDATHEQKLPSSPRSGALELRISHQGKVRTIPIDRDELTVGKDEENDISLDDAFASSFHLHLSRHGNRGLWLRDLGSTNGTFIDGRKTREGELLPGTVVRVGESDILLEMRAPSGGAASGSDEIVGMPGMLGRHPSMLALSDMIERVAPSSAAVTIFGETGTGKELVARAIHAKSLRSERPLVPVNCAAITRELLESELFGHEKGAFTGADRARTGAFEEAHGGTLFLDEIGELQLEVQAKLLRALESGEIRRVGSSKPIHVDVRIVAATHVDLLAAARQGKFREDLYYRLCVFPLTLPPLRQRTGDLSLLTEHFLAMFAPGQSLRLSSEAREKLSSHAFTGNIRELRNVVHRALLLRRSPTIEAAEIIFDQGSSPMSVPLAKGPEVRADDDEYLYLPGRTMKECELEIMRRAVRREGGKSQAANELKVARSTLVKKLSEADGTPEE